MNESRARRYQRHRHRGRLAALGSIAGVLAVVALTPVGSALVGWTEALAASWPGPLRMVLPLILTVTAMLVVAEAAALPAALYVGLWVDGRYQSRRLSLAELLSIQVQLLLAMLPPVLLAAAIIRFSIWMGGRWWWLLASLGLAGALAAALRGGPIALASIARAQPLRAPSLEARLAQVASRAGIRLSRVDQIPVDDGDEMTALVGGVGGAPRIFLASTLLRDWSEDEIAVVVAHELGHLARRDLWRAFALNAAILTVALLAAEVASRFVTGPAPAEGSLAALPFVTLAAGAVWMLATPLRHAQSRRHEREADRFALAVTGSPDAFATVIRRLGARHLADDRPSRLTRWLNARHPSVSERLALAEAYRHPGRAEARPSI